MIHNIIADLLTATPKELINASILGLFLILFGIFTEKNKKTKKVTIVVGCIPILVVGITLVLQATM